MKYTLDKAGYDLIKKYEGCKLVAYLCPARVWTIGYGHTGTDVTKGLIITQAKAEELLKQDVRQFEEDVNKLVRVDITQNMFNALVSFAYNVGSDIDVDDIPEGLGDSSLLRYVNNGDFESAAAEFSKWNKARGKVLKGLIDRREDERRMFLS